MSSSRNNTNSRVQPQGKKNVIVASALYPGLNKENGQNAGNRKRREQPAGQKPVAVPPGTQLIPMTEKEIRKLRRAHRRNLDYFYVMRRFVCFLMALFLVLYTAVIVLGIVPVTAPYTAYATLPDNTPWDVRDAQYEETMIEYVDQTVGISAIDVIYGYINSLFDLMAPAPAASAAEEEGEEPEEEVTPPIEEEAAPEINYYTTYLQLMEDRKSDFEPTDILFIYAFKYTPVAMAFAFIVMLVTLLKSVFALRGRKLRKAFGLAAILMFVSAAVVAVGLIGLSNAVNANPNGLNDLSQLTAFFTNVFYGAPYTVQEALMYPPLTLVGGLLVPVMLVVPILTLIFSFFCKKRVYYNIFNK